MRFSKFARIAFLGLLSACGGTPSKTVPAEQAFRVALLTPGPITDHSWNAGAYTGLLQIRDSLGAENYETSLAYTGEEGFFRINAEPFDLVKIKTKLLSPLNARRVELENLFEFLFHHVFEKTPTIAFDSETGHQKHI